MEEKGSGYKDTVLSVVSGSAWRTHDDGYGDQWDEEVGPQRIRRRSP